MVSGVSMIAGAAGKDFIGTVFYGMLFMIPLMIPAFATIFPGSASAWVKVLPSYPMVQGVVNEFEDKLNALELRPVVLRTRCRVCPA